ncbi:hypothetical protein G6F31_014925 [Rhizopus arrhizus]|nr:hypothetical protein G6F31_014925 [Rhizopus arrhizus]
MRPGLHLPLQPQRTGRQWRHPPSLRRTAGSTGPRRPLPCTGRQRRAVRRWTARPAAAGRACRGRRLRAAPCRRLLGLPAGGGGRRRCAGRDRSGARRRPARLHRAADPAAAGTGACGATLLAPAAAAGRARPQTLEVAGGAAGGHRAPAAGAAPALAAARPGPCGAGAGTRSVRPAGLRATGLRPGAPAAHRHPAAARRTFHADVAESPFPHLIPGQHSMTSRVALVTGGTGGIGTAICQRLADQGHRVATNYRDEAKARAWQQAMTERGRTGPGRDPGQQRRHHP